MKIKKNIAVISLIIVALAPFLPMYNSYNYVYDEGQIGDGIIVVVSALLSIYFVAKSKYKKALFFEDIALFLSGYLFLNLVVADYFKNIKYGLYILVVGALISFIYTILLIIEEKKERNKALSGGKVFVKDVFTGNTGQKLVEKEMVCPKCNNKVDKTHLYCPICNNRL